ncbi:DUF6497 family protein [Ruegeria conchae]|uniref:Acetolactate synthase n=2 Tax=Ruegeria conchae TaxID=981384 RepID=A0A497ZVC1_9RHOB|nr:DUF6497 family protein [Ruegeria conchae]RLK11154.1 hypothetical protein CLV75_1149 [Ruegeria conchae]
MIDLIGHKSAFAAQASSEGLARAGRFLGSALALAMSMTSSVQASNLLPVPSGQPVELSNVLLDTNPGELWVRFRFIAPNIGATVGRITYDVAVIDMEHLCQTLAVPYVAQHDLDPARVVISFSDRPLEFGTSEPDATQFFEAYRLEQSQCIWEGL